MKKIVLLSLLVLMCTTSFAQTDEENPPVIRSGNTYVAGYQVMNKKAFMGYLQSRDAVSYQLFQSAYQLSNVGWGLFGGGLLVECVSTALFVNNYDIAGNLLYSASSCITISGIVCLAVGYSRMHDIPLTYNARIAKQKSNISLNVVSSHDGVGIALSF